MLATSARAGPRKATWSDSGAQEEIAVISIPCATRRAATGDAIRVRSAAHLGAQKFDAWIAPPLPTLPEQHGVGPISPLESSWTVVVPVPVAKDRTETYPATERTYHYGTDLITALRVLGADIEVGLVNGQDVFTFGQAETCDLRVERKYLAPLHARIERVPNSNELRITNVSSGKNHIVHRGTEAPSFHIEAGDSFTIGNTTYYALNDEMRLARPQLSEVFGAKQYSAIDAVLMTAINKNESHIMLIGEPGCEQEALGLAIHHISRRRRSQFVEAFPGNRRESVNPQKISSARGGTMLVWLPTKGKCDPSFVDAAVQADARIRLIICAHSPRKAEASFSPKLIRHAETIEIVPLRHRKYEIPGLLDQWFVKNKSLLRFNLLKDEVRQRLLAYSWEGNLQELRTAAEHLEHLSQYQSERQATKDTNITRKASRYWRSKTRLPIPIVDKAPA